MLRGCRRMAAFPTTAMRLGSSFVRCSTTRSDRPATGRSYSAFPVSLSKIETPITIRGLSVLQRGQRQANANNEHRGRRDPIGSPPRSDLGLGTWGLERAGREGRDELESLLRNGLNEARVVAAVAERGADLRYAVGKATIEIHVRVLAPDGFAQLVTGDKFSGARHQQRERLGGLPLDRDGSCRSCAAPCRRRRIRRRRSDTPSVVLT